MRRGSAAGGSRRAERGRAGLCAGVCARGRRHPLSRGADGCPGGCCPRSGPGRSRPVPSRNGAPSPSHPARPCLCATTGTRPWVPRKPAGRWETPEATRPAPGGSRRSGERREGGEKREDAAAAAAEDQGPAIPVPALRGPASPPAFPSRASAPPQPPAPKPVPHAPSSRPPPPPAFSRSPCGSLRRLSLSFPLPLSFLSLPGALFSSQSWSPWAGAEGRAMEVRGRTEVGDWVCPGTKCPGRGI